MELFAVITSIAAIVISGLSWWESRRSRIVSEAVSRAILHVASATITEAMSGGGTILLRIENVGKSLAREVELKCRSCCIPNPGLQATWAEFSGQLDTSVQSIPMGEIPPQIAKQESVVFKLPQEKLNEEWPALVILVVDLHYTDSASGSNYTDHLSLSTVIRGEGIPIPEMFNGPLPPAEAFTKAMGVKPKRMIL